jgi:hypothetical protein
MDNSYITAIRYWSKQEGYSSIAVCANIFIRGNIPCSQETKSKLIRLREIAMKTWSRTRSDQYLGQDSLVWQATMKTIRSSIRSDL